MNRLWLEIKFFIKSLEVELAKRETSVRNARDASAVALSNLTAALESAKACPLDVEARTDPFILDRAVRRAMEEQTNEENVLREATTIWQAKAGHFEKHVVGEKKAAWCGKLLFA